MASFPNIIWWFADSDTQAQQAKQEGEKTLQQKSKEAAGSMTRSIQDAYDNAKAKAQDATA